MAFHYDARGDSSSEETTSLDLNAWKSGSRGARPSSQHPARSAAPTPTPTASVETGLGEDNSDDNDTSALAAIQKPRKRKSSSLPAGNPFVISFQAINRLRGNSREEAMSDVLPLGSSEPIVAGQEEDGQPSGNRAGLIVQIPRNNVDRSEYEDYTVGSDRVRRVLWESQDENGSIGYKVMFDDFDIHMVSFKALLDYDNGPEALAYFERNPQPEEEEDEEEEEVKSPPLSKPRERGNRDQRSSRMSSTRPTKRARYMDGFVSTVDNIDGSDGGASEKEGIVRRTTGRRRRQLEDFGYYKTMDIDDDDDNEEEDEMESEDELSKPTRRGLRNKLTRTHRSLRARRKSTYVTGDEPTDENDNSDDLLQSDLPNQRPRRRRTKPRGNPPSKPEMTRLASMRQSERATRHVGGMREIDIDDIYRSGSEDRVPARPKLIAVREFFKQLPRNSDFRMRHNQFCDTCGQGTNFAPLIGCQGCSLAYHKSCIGHRTNREHLVTKIDEGDFVLQCRRCIAYHRKKDPTAPDFGKCQGCHQNGACCRPFRHRKSPAQEQKERDDNDGVDPSYPVPKELINNADNVMFRCIGCFRAFHWEHLPSRSDMMNLDMDVDAEQRFREYSRDWKCKECVEQPARVSGLIAWKPIDEDAYDPTLGFEGLEEDEKVYLVRWEGMSYFRARWMPGPWVWGVTTIMMRKAFAKRDDAQHPKMRTEDAIPEDYLRADIVLDIKFTSIVDIGTEEIDKARIREVEKALIKYKGLTYEDAVWEAPPGPDDGERWTDFVMAYNDWVAGRYVRQPKATPLKARLEKVRKENFQSLEKQTQPENVQGGKLMEYQIQGLNWLYYKWFTQKNAILADEMGLGKTIQIIGFLATLVQDHNCYPFLVVVPNSTCPNWRREIKRWVPSLRVVAYYGSKESRDLAFRHELYPEAAKDLRCHIVVTSYDTAADENCRKFFRGVSWQGLIVDEGQRLKNDKNLLYSALGALKAPFKILLTGTPLQNNTRELFNLLQFLDDTFNAGELEKDFEELTQDKINKLHEMIRPFFLRRTKAQVLTFLPPMAQIIIPVSMSLVQKKLYRSIFAKNPELMKAIFSTEATAIKQGERGSLSNILMQLRKCLCHPFVYSKSIEDRNVDMASSHRNLVDASSKLKLLEILLPKLRERGHRVLIFSQFLEMLDIVEDFLDGMELRHQRLDGSMNAMTKQKRIDEYNAPDSKLFAFLLSTRAGGVGINLATADTVIILDPDFNPHQDIQALSRAHRIGQNKKVLCFQLVTRASAEERVMQIGRKKLALDHVLIQEMDADDAEQNDLVSVLRHGASELFEDSGDQDIVYDAPSIERLLDRSHIEDTQAGADKSAETQFSFARVWANDQGVLEEAVVTEAEESVLDPGVWAKILKERERVAAEEAATKAEVFGRGRRARTNNVDYTGFDGPDGADGLENSTSLKHRKKRDGSESDTDFQANDTDASDDLDNGENLDNLELKDLNGADTKPDVAKQKHGKTPQKQVILSTPAANPKTTRVKWPKKSTTVTTLTKATVAPKPPQSMRQSNGANSNGTALQQAKTVSKRQSMLQEGRARASKGRSKKTAATVLPKKSKKSAVSASTPDSPPIIIDLDDEDNRKHLSQSPASHTPTFRRAVVPRPTNGADTQSLHNVFDVNTPPTFGIEAEQPAIINCRACQTQHIIGECPLKLSGVEHCNLCGMAHFGHARVCPHIQSETQVRAMLEALKYSNEPEHLVNEARRYLRGVKGSLVQAKKMREEKAHAVRETFATDQYQHNVGTELYRAPFGGYTNVHYNNGL